jgi:hypothetical protein
MKMTTNTNIDVTKLTLDLFEGKITSKEFKSTVRKLKYLKKLDSFINKLSRKNGTTKY